MDLYRRERNIRFDSLSEEEKKYYIVPLRLVPSSKPEMWSYVVDKKLIQRVTQLSKQGYATAQRNILEWFANKGSVSRIQLLKKWMYVKHDKPNSVYHAEKILEDLKHMDAKTFAMETRNQTTDLGC